MQDDVTTRLEGRIERVTFRNPESHYMIARFRVAENNRLITILGHLPDPSPGETLRLSGSWKQHPKYGQQFSVSHFEVLLPSGIEEIRRYLSSGLIRGIGPKIAERLLRHFKADTLSIIENEPQRLAEVRGIGPESARRIDEAWRAHHNVRALMVFLQDSGVKAAHGARIYKTYGDRALSILQNDPYRLAVDLPRIGFYIADAVVRHLDLPFDETDRARGCLRYLLEEAADEGHTFIPMQALVERCSSAFEIDFHAVQEALAHLVEHEQAVVCPDAPDEPVYPAALYEAEDLTARRLRVMLDIPVSAPPVDAEQIMAEVVKRLAIQLSDTQLSVLESVLRHRVVIITGGPGTGKTTLIRAIAAIFEAVGRDYLLAAPTGRAARRMAEVTGRKAGTLHKLLGFNLSEERFQRDQDDPIDTQALIVDEASMVDALLMGHLIKALPLQAHLILVGDASQLPSVGAGTVLADLIESRIMPTFELDTVFRQAARSPIISAAHQVRQGIIPDLGAETTVKVLKPFTFLEKKSPEAASRAIVDLCARILPEQTGVDSLCEVQVLTPMHKGVVGTLHLNQVLQAALNPEASAGNPVGGRFFLHDKVMHLRNNYQKEVFNGEIGTICRVDVERSRLDVDYDGRQVAYDEADLEELSLAYAISVHKSQGSEYPVIVLPMVTQHYVMLQRNLLYTALTRAQKMVILVGSPKAVRVAVESDQPRRRQTLLTWRLGQAQG